MKFKISKKILEKFPELNIGVLVVQDIDNSGSNKAITKLLRKQESEIRKNFNTETLSQNPKISAWRTAYSSFGAKPKKYKCSVENLYRMILNEIELKPISNLVDIYNYVSIKYIIPLGGDDTDKIDGTVTLKIAKGDEPFTVLNSEEVKSPKQGEVIYADDKEVLCRRWNWRECDKSKMTENTKNATLVIEGLPPFTKADISNIMTELAELVKKFCGGKSKMFILNNSLSEIKE